MIFILYLISFLYFLLIFSFFIGLFLNEKKSNEKINNISVIIAARNEETNLPYLFASLQNQNYPEDKYEVIFADDRSNDDTYQIAIRFQNKYSNLRVVQIKEESDYLVGKKGAITKAINSAKNDILAFTDADCIPSQNWLKNINKHFDENTDFVAGYSILTFKNKFLYYLKNLERSALFAVIAGSFGLNWKITCTAGNMAYRKKLFKKVNGFEEIGHIRSGDDDLMLQKMKKHINKIRFMYLPGSSVISKGNDDMRKQIQQETRRGSKWKYYPLSIKFITLFVFISYIAFSSSLGLLLFNKISLIAFSGIVLLKIIPEFLLLVCFLLKIKKIKLMWIFPIAELFYIPYYIYFGIKGTFGKYRWKN